MGLKPRSRPPRASGRTVAGYIAELQDWRGDVVSTLTDIILTAAPKATASIKWSQPVFEQEGPFAYVRAFGKHVNVGFWRGADLSVPGGTLAGSGSKMRHIKIASAGDIDRKLLEKLVVQATKLNKKLGDPTRG